MVAVQVMKMPGFESILKMFIEQDFSGLNNYKSQSTWPTKFYSEVHGAAADVCGPL